MATTFTWNIHNVDLIPLHNERENVIYKVVWECTATADDKTKSQMGVIELDVNTTSTNFISIEEVTKEQIITWVKEKVAVKVIEDGLMPTLRTISFADVTATNVTVATQLAAAEAASNLPPSPDA
jgi:hypothetical protein